MGVQEIHFLQDLGHRPACLPAPDVGDDAIGTKVVAAVHDRHVTGDVPLVPRQLVELVAFAVSGGSAQGDVDDLLLVVHPYHIVDLGSFLAHVIQQPLGHAAGDHQSQGMEFLLMGEKAQPAPDPAFSRLAHRAGVQDDKIGFCGVFGFGKTSPEQTGFQRIALRHVHLAAIGFDIECTIQHARAASSNATSPTTR